VAVETTDFGTSVVVVSYNTREKLRRCLSSIECHHQVIVVDNRSDDGSADMVAEEFPATLLIRNLENMGFGPANNQGAKLAERPLVLYLNSDAYPQPGAIDALAECFSDPKVVAAGPMLLNVDGTLQESAANQLTLWAVFCEQTYLEKLFSGNSNLNPYWTTTRLAAHGGIQATVQVMGAALMCRAGLEEFDERYFLYCEDTDLCLRLSRHGAIVFDPEPKVIHELGSSSSASRWKAVARYNRGKELYFRIHHGPVAIAACFALDRIGALVRLIVWFVAAVLSLFLVKRFRGQVLLFLRVLAAPLSGPTR
jgi:N-acetylglucosaminyl-diphospho-decaprenol L-rhamnosyltransferase